VTEIWSGVISALMAALSFFSKALSSAFEDSLIALMVSDSLARAGDNEAIMRTARQNVARLRI